MRQLLTTAALVLACQQGPADPVARHVDYLKAIGPAEEKLGKGDFAGALKDCDAALALSPKDTALSKTATGGATAHVLRAAALAGKKDLAGAFAALDAAATNAWTGLDLLHQSPWFEGLRADARWKDAIAKFPAIEAGDRFAGKTVTTPRMGNTMIMARMRNFPKVGETAPEIDLPALDKSAGRIQLSSWRGKKPVVLVFGSYT